MSVKYEAVSFQTKDKLTLNGLFSLPKNAKSVCIYIHGLFDDVFNGLGLEMAEKLYDEGYGILVFNNRGTGFVSSFTRYEKQKKNYVNLGTAYETFTDCVYDLDAASAFLQANNVKKVHLIGHSTGCQKAVYYVSQLKKQSKIKSVILFAPLSDYSVGIQDPHYAEKLGYAQLLVKSGQKHQLLPQKLYSELLSAQRYVSLYSPNSKEEIFTYASDKKAKILRTVSIPTLAVFGENDEYLDRPVLELVEWFEENIHAKAKQVEWIEGANHSFKGEEKQLGKLITSWLEAH